MESAQKQPPKKRRDVIRSRLLRLVKKLVHHLLKSLNSIGDYKHELVERYGEAYRKTHAGMMEAFSEAGIAADFSVPELLALSQKTDRIEGLTDKKTATLLTKGRDATSIVRVQRFCKANKAMVAMLRLALHMAKGTVAEDILGEVLEH